ncbi:MAG: trypsin-like peptidase domain-containing protein [Candidatus Eisenbacteria sp.]|nr:trypsin-like peptidase domain-containing protein [Candidatus Eisenbacteria bacterium]
MLAIHPFTHSFFRALLCALAPVLFIFPGAFAIAIADDAGFAAEHLGEQIAAAQHSIVVVISQPQVSGHGLDERARPRRLVGCGVVVDGQGHLLTTASVVQSARRVMVIPMDGKPIPGEVIGVDPALDLAVVRLPSGAVPGVAVGNSDSLQTGAWVALLAAGHGSGPMISLGVLTGRSELPMGYCGEVLRIYAPIRPGDSGAVLLNEKGEAVGIVSATLEIPSRSGDSGERRRDAPRGCAWALGDYVDGIAIPMNDALSAAWEVIERGPIHRGFLGVTVQQLSPRLKEVLGLESGLGAYVLRVVDGGPAAEAGIRMGDVIVGVDGGSLADLGGFHRWVVEASPGDRRQITVVAGGQRRDLAVRIGDSAQFVHEFLPGFTLQPGWSTSSLAATSVRRNELEGEVDLLKIRLEELERRLEQLDR